MRYRTRSARETRGLGELLGQEIGKTRLKTRGALIVALLGDLGSGKTTFIQGFARGIGVKRRTVSPTFTIMRRYAISRTVAAYRTGFRSLVHVDAYRVHKPAELKIIRFEEWLADPTALVLIEWADLVRPRIPRTALRVRFEHQRGDARAIVIQGKQKARR
jgi:tRNA threonylcarbamoyladenosine biosynthesis protein TsaE